MKEIDLNIFDNLEEAIVWLEELLSTKALFLEDGQTLKGEISFIANRWRVGVIIESKQLELDF